MKPLKNEEAMNLFESLKTCGNENNESKGGYWQTHNEYFSFRIRDGELSTRNFTTETDSMLFAVGLLDEFNELGT